MRADRLSRYRPAGSDRRVMTAMVALMVLGGCGGTAAPETASSVPAGASAPADPSAGQEPSAEADPPGPAVKIENDGYRYELRAFTPRIVVAVDPTGEEPVSAPPEKVFLTVRLMVTNPLTDRQEPLDKLIPNNGDTMFMWGAPIAHTKAFGDQTCTRDQFIQDLPKTMCGLQRLRVLDRPESGGLAGLENEHIPAGASIEAALYYGPMPSSAPMAELKLYFRELKGNTATRIVELPLPAPAVS